MGGASQVAMRVASQVWQIVFASQTLQVFHLALRKKAQYVVMIFTKPNPPKGGNVKVYFLCVSL
jgi:hypothetical protein